jgi:hypothetical protein
MLQGSHGLPLYAAPNSVLLRHVTMLAPVPKLVERQVSALPTARGPSCKIHVGISPTRAPTPSVPSFVQAAGSCVMHCVLNAFSRHVTMTEPVGLKVMALWPTQSAAVPVLKRPRAVIQAGRSKPMGMAPLSLPILAQADGTEGQAAVLVGAAADVVGLLHTLGPVGTVLPTVKPRAISRHVMTLRPLLEALITLVARQVAAEPAAKGPRAAAHRSRSGMRARPWSLLRLTHGCGSVEMQRPWSALRMQELMLVPVVDDVSVVAKQVATLPAANGPSAAAHVPMTGRSRKPLVEVNSEQPAGSCVAHTWWVLVGPGLQEVAELEGFELVVGEPDERADEGAVVEDAGEDERAEEAAE